MTLPPCLYMLWPTGRRRIAEPAVAPGYRLRTLQRGDDQAVIELIGSDGETMGKAEWQHYQNMLLPDGLFLIEQVGGCLVETAGAAHNPDPGRHYFPYGGELGYLIVFAL